MKKVPRLYGGPVCIICGKPGIKHKLPHGQIHLCNNKVCQNLLAKKLYGSIPVLWADFSDLVEHTILSEEQLKPYTEKDECDFTRLVTDYIWRGETLGEIFHEVLEQAAERMEEMRVMSYPERKLPLFLVESLEFPANKTRLEKRLKGEAVEGIVAIK